MTHGGAVAAPPGLAPVLGSILAVALGGSFLAVVFLHAGTVWRNLSTVRLAVVTLSSVGILSVIGTMVVQRFGAGSLPEPEKEFVEKFTKGQGSMVPNARFIVSPPEVVLTAEEMERIDLTRKAFGKGRADHVEFHIRAFHERSQKAQAIEKHVEARREHLLRLFDRLEAMGFTTVFRTWWFNALLVLLFVQVVSVILKRYPWGRMQFGWVLTHVGVLVTLAGCVISDLFLRDGSLGLSPGQSEDSFQETTRLDARGKPTDRALGYRVKMLGTDQSFYHELQIAFPGVAAGNDILWTQEQLRPGRTVEIRDPGTDATYTVRIREVWERAGVGMEMVSGGSVGRPGGVPALHVRILHLGEEDSGTAHAVAEGWLFADSRHNPEFPYYFVRYHRAATAAEAEALAAGKHLEGRGKHGWLRVRVPGVAEPVVLPATPTATATATGADGTAWSFTVTSFHSNFLVGRPAAPETESVEMPERPALRVEVRKGDASAPMVVYGIPELQAQWEEMVRGAAHGPSEGVSTRIGAGPAAEPSYEFEFIRPQHAYIVEGPDGKRTFTVLAPGQVPATRDFSAPGPSVPLGIQGLQVSLVAALPDAVPDIRIQPMPQETDEEYLATCIRTLETGERPAPTVSVARIEITEKDRQGTRTRDEWLVAGREGVADDRRYRSTDGRLLIVMAETKNSLMFRSALEVQTLDGKTMADGDGPVRRVVRVNHPLHWGGYAYYQNNFIAESANGPAASVFRVKYDRGIPTIYTGFVMLTLGVCVMLYVNPAIRKRKAAKAAAAAGGSAPANTAGEA